MTSGTGAIILAPILGATPRRETIPNSTRDYLSELGGPSATKAENIPFRWIWCVRNFNVQHLLHYAFDLPHFCSIGKRLSSSIIWLFSNFYHMLRWIVVIAAMSFATSVKQRTSASRLLRLGITRISTSWVQHT